MLRAARLDPQLYEEVEADERSLGQAMGGVVPSGIGTFSVNGASGIAPATVGTLLGWHVWAIGFLVQLLLLLVIVSFAGTPQA
jgi:hypothetical protein